MSILSFEFLAFVLVAVVLFYCLPARWRWALLLLASLFFYAANGIGGALYLLAVALLTYLGARSAEGMRVCEQAARDAENPRAAHFARRQRGVIVAVTLTLCLGAMIFLKYFDALRGGVNALLEALRSRESVPALDLLVPLGLSYFTFQSVGYLIDVSRGKCAAEKNPLRYLLFVSFFPQIAQGPISTYRQLAPQLREPARFSPERLTGGFLLMLWGYFKKLVIADRLARLAPVFAQEGELPGWLILGGAALYMIRLYADFSGGMDIIRGVARMLGVDLAENFKRPFFSLSVAEYWRRWHITLGAWFRSYVFYPLTTSRAGLNMSKRGVRWLGKKAGRALPGAVATFIVFLAIGLWHAANWNAALYGAYFGALLGLALLLEPFFNAAKAKLRVREQGKPWRLWCLTRTWALLLTAQYFAFTDAPARAFAFMRGTFMNWRFDDFLPRATAIMSGTEWLIAGVSLLCLLAVDCLCEKGVPVARFFARCAFPLRWLVLLALILSILIFGCYGAGYDGAAFLYAQF